MMRARRGFTLIEMMIALVVSLVVVAGLYGIFTLQSRQFYYQDLQMEMHQNMRFATDVLTRSIRMAGFNTSAMVTGWGGTEGADDSINALPAVQSYDDWSGDGHDAIAVVYGDPSLVVSSTMMFVEECDTTGISFLTNMLDFDDKLAEYESGDLLLCLDYAAIGGMESYLWVITSVDASDPTYTRLGISGAYGTSDYDAVCPSGENLTPVMSCSKAEVTTFYIDSTDDGVGPGSPENPVLMMDMDLGWPESDDVPLVEHVEDLQVDYCLDDGGGTSDCSSSGAWTSTIDMTAGDVPWMVRTSLVIRSSREDYARVYTGTRPALSNHDAAFDSDHYYRQVLVSSVTARNLRIQSVIP